MKEFTGKIKKSTFSNEWKNPSGGMTYYFDVVMENGDKGSVGVSERHSEKVVEGAEVSYSMIGVGKIKINSVVGSQAKPTTYSAGGKKPKSSTQEAFLGYAWSYAKDLIIAGKTMKDVDELNKVARYIYNEIGEMLNNDNPPF